MNDMRSIKIYTEMELTNVNRLEAMNRLIHRLMEIAIRNKI